MFFHYFVCDLSHHEWTIIRDYVSSVCNMIVDSLDSSPDILFSHLQYTVPPCFVWTAPHVGLEKLNVISPQQTLALH